MNKIIVKQIALVLSLTCSTLANATQNDDAFEDYINNIICENPEGNLVSTCEDASTTIGGSGETLSQTGNTGTQGVNELAAREKQKAAQVIEKFDNWSIFSSYEYANLDRDLTDIENGYSGHSQALTVGADYRMNSALLLGLAISMKDSDIDMDGGAGSVDSDSQEWVMFMNYQVFNAFYIDGYLSQANIENSNIRSVSFGRIQYQARSDFDSKNTEWGLGISYPLSLDAFALDISAQYKNAELELDSFSEQSDDPVKNLNLHYQSQQIDSETITLSLNGSFNWSIQSGVVIPYVSGEWIVENENKAREIETHLVLAPDAEAFVIVTDAPDDAYGRLSAGVQYIMSGGLMFFMGAESLVKHEYFDSWSAAVGFRLEL